MGGPDHGDASYHIVVQRGIVNDVVKPVDLNTKPVIVIKFPPHNPIRIGIRIDPVTQPWLIGVIHAERLTAAQRGAERWDQFCMLLQGDSEG